MQRMFLVVGVAAILFAPSARAFSPNPTCVRDAISARRSCKATCDQNFKEAKDLCNSVDHACADTCRAAREACVGPTEAVVQTCISGCNNTLNTARVNCRALYGKGTTERDQCVDVAQVTAFVCRDTCRENIDRAALEQCRADFRACIGLCPPASN